MDTNGKETGKTRQKRNGFWLTDYSGGGGILRRYKNEKQTM
jgi:hypothetical protein